MIFDCHTHVAEPHHLSGPFLTAARKAWGEQFHFACTPAEHKAAMKACSGAIVLAVDAPATGFNVPNAFVAEYVKSDPGKLFGFASVDPARAGAERILEEAVKDLGLKGLKLAPIYQDFHPLDNACYPLYAKARELKLPVMWHQGTSFVPEGPLEKSRPADLDPVARSFPELNMVIAHMGHPWIGEAIGVIRKQPNVYADISALCGRPWQMYNAIVTALEYGAGHKLLFGTDFPFFTVEQTVGGLHALNRFAENTNLPVIPDTFVRELLERDTVGLLGLSS